MFASAVRRIGGSGRRVRRTFKDFGGEKRYSSTSSSSSSQRTNAFSAANAKFIVSGHSNARKKLLIGAGACGLVGFAASSLGGLGGLGGAGWVVGGGERSAAVRIQGLGVEGQAEVSAAPVSYPMYRLFQRFVHLSFTFLPAILLSPLVWVSDEWADWWISVQLKNALERAGPAFIKYAQWAATRRDLFSVSVCDAFQELQTKAPEHGWEHTQDVLHAEFGRPVEALFTEFDRKPVASGSVAQVHRAVLSAEGARLASTETNPRSFREGAVVAVKVRHPGVKDSIELDFELLNFLASASERVVRFWNKGKSSLASAQIKESLMQFGAPMREQIDLRSEARHLDSFARNFKWWWARVRFPLPSAMVTEDILVETFETGDHISDYLDRESEHNRSLANLGLKTYLKMLIQDNLIHADLHPGNILVHLDSPREGSFLKKVADTLRLDIEIPRIVLLDVGMTTRLTETEQGNLVRFFDTLTRMDGLHIAESILAFAEAVDDATGFKSEMRALFDKLEPEQLRKNTQEIIGDMMDTIREHNIQIPGVVSNVIISTVVLEGWSSKLDPSIRILESLKQFLPESVEERLRKVIERGHGGFSTEN